MAVVIDTNIFVSAIMNAEGAPRQVLRLALQGVIQPLMGNALLSEYEDVLGREELFRTAPISLEDRQALFFALMKVSRWTSIYYLWRPNLPDEGDNHLIELALAGGASVVITANKRDLRRGELIFPSLKIQTAGEFLETYEGSA